MQKINQQDVLKALQGVIDSVSGKNIVAAGMVREVEVSDSTVFIHLQSAKADADYVNQIKTEIVKCVSSLGVEKVDVQISQGKSAGVNPQHQKSGHP